jgi:hypothetical protein
MNKKVAIMACSVVSVYLTWFINHNLGLGSIIANGIVGLIAILTLPKDLAGVSYTASFVGMSSMVVVPSILATLIAGVLVGSIIILTPTIYAGVGGKGGTTAAVSTIISRLIYSIIG